jgi:hypothetical protein
MLLKAPHATFAHYRYAGPRFSKRYVFGLISFGTAVKADADKYSVILPTYNEKKNLPVIIWLLAKTFEAQ